MRPQRWPDQWINVFHWSGADGDRTALESIDLTGLADYRRIRIRWRFSETKWDNWWAVDQIRVSGEKETDLAKPVLLSLSINGGATTTTNTIVILNNAANGNPTLFAVSEQDDFRGAQWKSYSTAPKYVLSTNTGTKTVLFKVKNGAVNHK